MKYFFSKVSVFILILNSLSLIDLNASPSLLSTNASINGYIKDLESEETLIGASVAIVGTKKGAYTNKAGYFSIVDIPDGEYSVKISMMGYLSITDKFKFEKGKVVRKDFLLKPNSIKTSEISVISDRDVETRQISISKVNIPVDQIKEIRIGGESDVFRTIQMLPGVLTSSQISSGLYIRGGSPDQNLVLLDGSTVYNPSHLFGFISTFNSDAIKDVELLKGGYPAEYGSRLSAVLNITQKDGNRNQTEGTLSTGLISSKLSLEGPIGNGSWFIGGRRTYFDLIKGALDTDPKNPIPDFGFYDINGKITQDLSQNDKIFFSGFLSKDNFDYGSTGLDVNLFMGNKAGSLRWTHIFGDNLFTNVNFTGSFYDNGFKQDVSGYLIKLQNTITDYTIKANSEWFVSDILSINSGIEITNYTFTYESNFTGEDTQSDVGTNKGGLIRLEYQDWLYNAFFQVNHKLGDLFNFQLGTRVNYWDYSKYTTFDPRAAIRYELNPDFSVKASWGIYHQYLRLSGDENFSLFDTWLPTDNTVQPATAYHYILSFETKPYLDFDLNFDVYYKDLYNISEANRTTLSGKVVNDLFYSGNGYAYGAEIFLQKKIGKLAGWIGYGLGFVRAKFDSINHGEEFSPKYDRTHDLKIVAQYELNERWSFGGTFMFQTGQSYTGAISRIQSYMPNDNFGYGKVVNSKRFGLRLPPSHQLNLSGTYKTTLFNLPFKIILDIYNVYNRRDILARTVNTNELESTYEDIKLLPILPTFSFEIKF